MLAVQGEIRIVPTKAAGKQVHRVRGLAQRNAELALEKFIDALFLSVTPWEVYERKLTLAQLHAAVAALPDKQAKRINAFYFLGMSKAEIAKAEGVNKSQVSRSINKALNKLEKILKNFQ